jgi:hypothetical protein
MENDGLKIVLVSGKERLFTLSRKLDQKIRSDKKIQELINENHEIEIDLSTGILIIKKDLKSVVHKIFTIQINLLNNKILFNLEKELYNGIDNI